MKTVEKLKKLKAAESARSAACDAYNASRDATEAARDAYNSARDAQNIKMVNKMNIHLIKTENDYRNTLQEIEGLMMAKTGSIEGDRLDVLVTLVEDYERKHYP